MTTLLLVQTRQRGNYQIAHLFIVICSAAAHAFTAFKDNTVHNAYPICLSLTPISKHQRSLHILNYHGAAKTHLFSPPSTLPSPHEIAQSSLEADLDKVDHLLPRFPPRRNTVSTALSIFTYAHIPVPPTHTPTYTYKSCNLSSKTKRHTDTEIFLL